MRALLVLAAFTALAFASVPARAQQVVVTPSSAAAGVASTPAASAVPASSDRGASDVVRVSGLLQVDAIPFDQSSVDELDPATRAPLNQERFVIPRARARLDARYGPARGSVQLDANTVNGPTVRLFSAEIALAYPYKEGDLPVVDLTLGLFLIPFGFETQELAATRFFLEPSTWVQALFPGRRDLGARLSGAWRFFRYQLAVMNGNPSATATLPERDPNRAKDLLGRLGVEGPLFAWLEARAGLSALYGRGFHAGTAPTKDGLVVRDANEDGLVQTSEIQLVPGQPGQPSSNFDYNALGGDLAFVYELPALGRGRLYGELTWGQNLDRGLFVADPVAQGRMIHELGYMAAFRQYATRHVELGARYNFYDPDRDASRRSGLSLVPANASFSTASLAVAWCTLPHLRVTLEYDHRENPLGRSRAGAPTTLAADSVTLRGQLEL